MREIGRTYEIPEGDGWRRALRGLLKREGYELSTGERYDQVHHNHRLVATIDYRSRAVRTEHCPALDKLLEETDL